MLIVCPLSVVIVANAARFYLSKRQVVMKLVVIMSEFLVTVKVYKLHSLLLNWFIIRSFRSNSCFNFSCCSCCTLKVLSVDCEWQCSACRMSVICCHKINKMAIIRNAFFFDAFFFGHQKIFFAEKGLFLKKKKYPSNGGIF